MFRKVTDTGFPHNRHFGKLPTEKRTPKRTSLHRDTFSGSPASLLRPFRGIPYHHERSERIAVGVFSRAFPFRV